jgi:LacI family transcriptional regulator
VGQDEGRTLNRRVTLRDVAAAAGVSAKTVSRVINHEPRVAPETARHVEDVIRRLGFRPDQVARSLARGQRLNLAGLIVSDLANPHVTALAHGVEQAVRASGHTLVMASADEDDEAERAIIAELLDRNVEGLVVVPSGSAHDHLETVAQRVPLVLAHRLVDGIEADAVVPDDLGATRLAVSSLLERGHRRIAFIGDWRFIYNIQQRLEGFVRAHVDAGVDTHDDLIVFGSHTAESARRIVADLLKAPDPPTAVFASNNLNCLGALIAVSQRGAQVDVLGFDEVPMAEHLGVPVTLLTYDQRALGSLAAGLLMSRLQGTSPDPPRRIVLPVRAVTLNTSGSEQ